MAKAAPEPKPTSVGIAGLYLDRTTRALVLRAEGSDAGHAENSLPPQTGGIVECRNAKLARAREKAFKEHGSADLRQALRVFPTLASPLEGKYGKRADFGRFLTDVENEFSQGVQAAIHVLLELDMPEKRQDRLKAEHPAVSFTQVFEKDRWLAEAGILLEVLSSRGRKDAASDPTDFREALATCLEYCMGEKAHPFAWRARKVGDSALAQETTA